MKAASILMNVLRRFARGSVYALCLGITIFIAANSYEIVSGRDVPFLSSVQRVDLSSVEPTLAKQSNEQLIDRAREGNFGRPDTLRLVVDKKPLRVVVAPGMKSEGGWLARANTSHVLYVNGPKAGNAGDMIVYTRQSWRTIPDPAHISLGANLFLDTNTGWRYMFRVQEVRHVSTGSRMVIPEARNTQLVLVVDQGNGQSYIIQCQFVSLQRSGQ